MKLFRPTKTKLLFTLFAALLLFAFAPIIFVETSYCPPPVMAFSCHTVQGITLREEFQQKYPVIIQLQILNTLVVIFVSYLLICIGMFVAEKRKKQK